MKTEDQVICPLNLIELAVMNRVRGTAYVTGEESIESDGRRRKRRIEALLAEGFITEARKDTVFNRVLYTATDKAYAEVDAEKPAVPFRPELYNWERYVGVALDELGLAERKYVAEHPEEFRYATMDRYTYEVAWHASPQAAWAATERKEPGLTRRADVYVTTDGYLAAKREHRFRQAVDKASAENLHWGLRRAGFLDVDERELLRSGARESPFHAGGSRSFSGQPEKWGEEILQQIAARKERIEKLQAEVLTLERLNARVAAGGGWAKFAETYVAWVEEGVREELDGKKD